MEIDLAKRDEAAQAGGDPIPFPLLQLISEARNEHGMRQQDFARYRHYCSSKAHRLRELLQLTHSDGKQKAESQRNKASGGKGARGKKPKKAQVSAAQSAAAKGHGNTFTHKTLEISHVKDERPALLLLFEAERAWAFSQELRSLAFEDDNNPDLRKRGISRLRRANQWSSSLFELVQALPSRFDVHARAEAAAYLVIIKATTAFDRSQWEKALQELSVARTLLNAIAENSKTSRAEALANSFVDAGEAQMRYSAYQLGNSEQDMDQVAKSEATAEVCEKVCPGYAELIKELEAAKAKDGDQSQKHEVSLSWHGHQIPVRNPELLDTIVHAQAEEAVLRDSVKIEALGQESAAASEISAAKRLASKKQQQTEQEKHGKRPRLSHAQRKAKKRQLSSMQNDSGAADAEAGASTSRVTPSTARLGKAGRTELDPFDRALSALTDAEEVARKLVEENAEALSKSHSARYETASKDLQTAHDFIFYKLLALRVWRNLRLVAEVERRAEKREKRAMANVEARLDKGNKGKKGASISSKSKKSRARKAEQRAAEASKKAPRKNPPGSKAKMTRSTPKQHRSKFGRSGTRALRTRQALARENRARAIAAQKSKRRGARAVPSLAKLLDAAETSLAAMGSISLIESEPDVSSLVEAKAAWFRSEVLRHLARAFALSGAHPEAILLLTRAQLYIRQARQSAELAEDVEEEDSDFPPRVKIDADQQSETVFDHSDQILADLKKEVQKEMHRANQQGSAAGKSKKNKKVGSTNMNESRAGQTLQEMARKYIDFDPVSLEEAKNIPADVVAEVEAEKKGTYAVNKAVNKKQVASGKNSKSQKTSATSPVAAVPAVKPVSGASAKVQDNVQAHHSDEAETEEVEAADEEEEEAFAEGKANDDEVDVSLAFDPANALAEEEEARLEAEAANKKKGWLGGWFGRG